MTRWDNIRETLGKIINQKKVHPADIPAIDVVAYALEFGCGKCKYFKDNSCSAGSTRMYDCREGYADYLNEEIGEK